MSNLPKTIKIRELPEATSINDTDIFIIEDGSVTHKITGKNLIHYIKNHTDINDYYVPKSSIDISNGVAPLNANRKIPSDNINFGVTVGTVFDGVRGKALEDGLDTHLLDNDPHGAKSYTDSKISETSNVISEVTDNLMEHIDDAEKHHTHGNKTVLDSITQEKINIWDSNSSGGTGVSSLADLGVNASATELNYVQGVTSDIQTQLNNKAPSNHGNHVPTTQVANNAVFLRNDNTWQTVTPSNIGAAPSSHSHNYASSSSAGGAAITALECTGNSATATKATQDANGNNIVDTYATKASLGTQVTYALEGTTLYITTK